MLKISSCIRPSTSFKQRLPVEFHGQKMLNIINLTDLFNVNGRGAYWHTCWPHNLKARGSTPAGGDFFFLLFGRFVLLCFLFFLTDLKYTGRLIAGSFSAFISKIINPQVIHRHPLIVSFTAGAAFEFIITKPHWKNENLSLQFLSAFFITAGCYLFLLSCRFSLTRWYWKIVTLFVFHF